MLRILQNLSVVRLLVANVKIAAVCIVPLMLAAPSAIGQQILTPAEIEARSAKEKEARRACKIDICKAFAAPTDGPAIACDVTKTWTKDEILARVVGGSFIWGYGSAQCSVKLNLDRGQLAKARSEPKSTASFPEHTLLCNVDDKDATKGGAFTVSLKITPMIDFENGIARSAAIEPVKTEGSSIAAAAVTSMMGIDKVSGLVSRAVANEMNELFYGKCKDDGVEIARK